MEKEKCLLFNRVGEQKLGEAVQSTDFGEVYEMPTYEPYVDDNGDGISHDTDADDELMPLTVVGRKRDSDGKPIR